MGTLFTVVRLNSSGAHCMNWFVLCSIMRTCYTSKCTDDNCHCSVMCAELFDFYSGSCIHQYCRSAASNDVLYCMAYWECFSCCFIIKKPSGTAHMKTHLRRREKTEWWKEGIVWMKAWGLKGRCKDGRKRLICRSTNGGTRRDMKIRYQYNNTIYRK